MGLSCCKNPQTMGISTSLKKKKRISLVLCCHFLQVISFRELLLSVMQLVLKYEEIILELLKSIGIFPLTN